MKYIKINTEETSLVKNAQRAFLEQIGSWYIINESPGTSNQNEKLDVHFLIYFVFTGCQATAQSSVNKAASEGQSALFCKADAGLAKINRKPQSSPFCRESD